MPLQKRKKGTAKTSSGKVAAAKKVPHTSARHRVRDGIERMILEGRVRPGEKLVQLHLSRLYGVSLGMVREALFELNRSGLIETIDNRGIFVRRLDVDAIQEFFVVRELFEGLAARECCGKLTAKHEAELRGLADGIYGLAIANCQLEKIELDRKFHSRIVEITGNRLLVDMSQQYSVLGKIIGADTHPKETLAGHMAIVDAIKNGDPVVAESIARGHVRTAFETIQRRHAAGESNVIYSKVLGDSEGAEPLESGQPTQ